tara:strand:+ start:1007 stop:1855 length:849 start_codon:yes stop_codon:yes gene_type:complete
MDREQVLFAQGSEEWLAWRNSLRTASNASTVMGVNKYETKSQLYQKMFLGKETKVSFAMQRGSNTEPLARKAAEKLLDVQLTPECWQYGPYGASLDAYGVRNGKTIKVEIKCPMSEKSGYWSDLQGEVGKINDMAFWQIAHQELCRPTDLNYLFVYLDETEYQIAQVFVTPEDVKQLVAAWDDFYENPPLIERNDKMFQAMAVRYVEIKDQMDSLKEALDSATLAIKNECTADTTGFGLKIVQHERKGSVDFARIAEENPALMASVESYRSKPTTYKKITRE